MNMRIEGVDELVNALENAATRIPDVKKKFLAREAGLIRGRTMKKTPVDTGLLRNSWKQTPATNDSVTNYDNVYYAPFVEFGHRVKIHGKFTGEVVKGKHMLRDALEESKSSIARDGNAILSAIFGGG